MALVKTTAGIADIKGGFGGQYFSRDKFGLHLISKPRRVHQITPAQRKQRNAFIKARTYSKDNRTVSYLIYRALNNLPFIFDAIVTGDPEPNCRGRYILSETKHDGRDVYVRPDGEWLIFYISVSDRWFIADDIDRPTRSWLRFATISGRYSHVYPASGTPFVSLVVQPPPIDYQIPKL